MRQLLEIDIKDYKERDTVFRRPSARTRVILGKARGLAYKIAKWKTIDI